MSEVIRVRRSGFVLTAFVQLMFVAVIRTSSEQNRVLRGSAKKNKRIHHHSAGNSIDGPAPQTPPSPDLRALSPEELAVLKGVLRRQEEFEAEEIDRQRKLRDSLMTFEDEVKRHASQKSRLKHVDLRLCRLCYKTKFADGIGRACYDCHKRVCNRCGSFSKPTWNIKKNKTVKGKWRCTMCQMKRDVVAMTGIWYHGNEGHSRTQSTKFKSKLSHSEMESSETDGHGRHWEMGIPAGEESGDHEDSDVFSEGALPPSHRRHLRRSSTKTVSRRRSASQSEADAAEDDNDVEDEIDDEQFFRERQLCRMERQNRRSRRKARTGNSTEWSLDSPEEVSYDRNLDLSGSETFVNGYSTDNYHSSDQNLTTQSDTSPFLKRSYRGYSYKTRDAEVDALVAESVRRLSVVARKENTGERFGKDNGERFRKDNGERFRKAVHTAMRKQRSDDHEKDVGALQKRQTIQGSRSQSLESEKIKPRRGIRQYLSSDNNDTSRVIASDDRNQKHTVPFDKSSSKYKCDTLETSAHVSNFDHGHSKHYRDYNVAHGHISPHDTVTSNPREARHSRSSCTSVESSDAHSRSMTPVSNRRKLERQSEAFYSSSSSLYKEYKLANLNDNGQHTHGRNVQTGVGRTSPAGRPPLRNTYLSAQRSSTNCLSPDMALHRHHRKARKTNPLRPGSASPRGGSDQEAAGVRNGDVIRDRHNRRMTLPYCINIDKLQVGDKKNKDGFSASQPHEILIHRHKEDISVQTQGLGMRVVGGRGGPGGTLGAYVTMVTKGGPADVLGISEGDQVVEWNGRSLVDVTFEEAQGIINTSGDIVQLSVIHSVTDRDSNPIMRSKHPIIIRSDTLPSGGECTPPRDLFFGRPKRRMLPKTPVEIKRTVRKISGQVWLQLDYDDTCQCLLVVLLRAQAITSESNHDRRPPSVVVLLHLLPNRGLYEAKESEIKYHTKDPHWNETFVFANISKAELRSLAMEVTFWNFGEIEDEFLGEVLLDLSEAKIDNSVNCYNLEDHDENSSPLPYRKKSFSLSDSAISPVTSIDTSSIYPSRDPSPRSSVSTSHVSMRTPAYDKMKEIMLHGKRSPAHLSKSRDKMEFSSSAQSSPQHSPTSNEFKINSSLTSLVKRKIGAVARMSTNRRQKRDSDSSEPGHILRSQSAADVRDSALLKPNASPQQPRRSFEVNQPKQADTYELLAPPHPLNKASSSGVFYNDEDDDSDKDCKKSPSPDRPAPEGDDITSLLGPGQVAPKPSFETSVCGDIKMGFMVSKGQLEIDIVVVRGLKKSGLSNPPDTYVKTYLVEGSKTVQKKKTQTVRANFDPMFRKTIKYSACNIHGRCIKVNVWDKQKAFDKKQCLGEAVVKLDNLDLSQHTMAWYKLFPVGAAEMGSMESLNYWPAFS
ncbi:regulating synaptic membrane exocytosis protein 2-like [Mya arenaria]|uniref:regulating synaptic membrane exocytosis protein 2-like n=1 Tax=Mya arenaria TaxID=6604 RepID=UPI0022E652E8|nr:regulating synaptic membrane exocytosis protein 2-like [Mya arenaria]